MPKSANIGNCFFKKEHLRFYDYEVDIQGIHIFVLSQLDNICVLIFYHDVVMLNEKLNLTMCIGGLRNSNWIVFSPSNIGYIGNGEVSIGEDAITTNDAIWVVSKTDITTL